METRSSPSMGELRALAAERGLKYFRHLSKPELFALLNRKEGGGSAAAKTMATGRIAATVPHESASAHANVDKRSQNAGQADHDTATKNQKACTKATRSSERISKRKRDASTAVDTHEDTETADSCKKAKTSAINTLDPIMLTELGTNTFEFVRTNGSVVLYNVDTLVQYVLATGDFSEPQTRIPFTEEDLRRMDVEAKSAGLEERSVLEAKQNKHEFDEQKVKRDGILGLERCAGEYVTKMLEVVESDDPEEGEMVLIMSVFPSFADIFEQIRRSDREYAKQCMNHFKAYLRGPKNRPNRDTSGLLAVILGFLDEVHKGQQNPSAFGF